ncbi:LysR substrate-binding domain-containing protein [Neorhizobium galegae]|uniref:LysR family transcriptional regulator n=1 Tax=Neorhizobium galegae TaxID=399 RepID=UPI000621EB0B|nr:LysR family transcriptional regulator [Neorhizobium galegae]MCQ1780600.1 LysR substrate-binding domain-containing protein [Neorhizobium galegae]MCQ1796443.1 LysR substrate-binding domain-containing protein [Neorhizobium galegae]CDZ27956.1 Transcriptional regulator PtxR [Neorhizobium galegae bv. officinalis]
MQDATNLNRLAYFVAVIDAGSFTRAAEYLGITKAVVSQQVARLEQEVGTTLLMRTTRRLQPTEAGRMFHARCVSILREAEDALGELAQARSEPKGLLRVTAPYDYGTSVIVPVVTAFTARYPDCKVELNLSDKMVDLVADHMDLAIRVGWLADSSLQARRIGSFQQYLVAPPQLAGRIKELDGLADLPALPFVANNALREPLEWRFTRGDQETFTVRFKASISINTTPAVMHAARHGGGLSVLPDFLARAELASGRLIHVLPDWQLPSGGVFTVYPAARFRPPKVSAFVEMLIAALRTETPRGE